MTNLALDPAEVALLLELLAQTNGSNATTKIRIGTLMAKVEALKQPVKED